MGLLGAVLGAVLILFAAIAVIGALWLPSLLFVAPTLQLLGAAGTVVIAIVVMRVV